MRTDFIDAVDRLSKAIAGERMRELEVEMSWEHQLTLPPATYPWDRLDRRDKVCSRTQILARVRGEQAKAHMRRWIRRVPTLGLRKKCRGGSDEGRRHGGDPLPSQARPRQDEPTVMGCRLHTLCSRLAPHPDANGIR